MRLYIDIYGGSVEISGVTFHTVHREIGGNSVLVAEIRSKENVGFSTISEYLWCPVFVTNNAADKTLWEGWIDTIIQSEGRALISAIDGVRLLDHMHCRHSSIISMGTVTSLADDYIEDTDASFTDGTHLNKAVFFTDISGLDDEVVYPNATSSIEGAPTGVIGLWSDMDDSGNTSFGFTDEDDDDNQHIIVNWLVPNHATSTRVELDLLIRCGMGKYYPNENERPRIYIYDDNGAAWITASADIEGNLSYMHEMSDANNWFRITTQIVDNISNYFDGAGNLKMKINAGHPQTSSPDLGYSYIAVFIAECTNIYSALFGSEQTVYTIDTVNSATKITFTGQTPDADGVDVGDTYRVGSIISTVAGEIWRRSMFNPLDLDFDVTTIPDSSDYYGTYIGPVFAGFADRLGRYLWHSIGWTISCKSSYTACTDDASTIVDADVLDWTWHRSGKSQRPSAVVYGGNVRAKFSDWEQKFPCPYTEVRTSQNITTQAAAYNYAVKLVSKYSAPEDRLRFVLNYDDGADYDDMDLGKTIGISILSGDINPTTPLIHSMDWKQNFGEDLYVEVTVI
jgi:hypothetical protein